MKVGILGSGDVPRPPTSASVASSASLAGRTRALSFRRNGNGSSRAASSARLPLLGARSTARRRRQSVARAVHEGSRQQLPVDPRHTRSYLFCRMDLVFTMAGGIACWDVVGRDVSGSGRAWKHVFWQMLQHVVNHASYHRGQVTTMLRQIKATPPKSMDLIAFYRERGAAGLPAGGYR